MSYTVRDMTLECLGQGPYSQVINFTIIFIYGNIDKLGKTVVDAFL